MCLGMCTHAYVCVCVCVCVFSLGTSHTLNIWPGGFLPRERNPTKTDMSQILTNKLEFCSVPVVRVGKF